MGEVVQNLSYPIGLEVYLFLSNSLEVLVKFELLEDVTNDGDSGVSGLGTTCVGVLEASVSGIVCVGSGCCSTG